MSAASAQAMECTHPGLTQAVVDVAATRAMLRSVPIVEGEETQIPEQAQRGLDRLKDGLGALVADYMSCVATSQMPVPAQIENALSALVRDNVDADGTDPTNNSQYGSSLSFKVELGADNRRLVSIVTRFGIQCGSDAMLSVFAPEHERWDEKLRWHSGPYSEVSGAFEAFQYAISPPDPHANWYVLAAHIKPWCSSTWSMLDYAVLRPGTSPTSPRLLLEDSRSMWWGSEDFGTLHANAADFDLRFHSASIDPGVHNRLFIRHYTVAGDSLRRTQPVAESPRDFVDEWSRSDWREAREWTDPRTRDGLQSIHERLRNGDHGQAYFTFESIKSCASVADGFQIEVLRDAPEERWFFHVRGRTRFLLTAVESRPDSRCTKELPGAAN
jgi:hypothetical protein